MSLKIVHIIFIIIAILFSIGFALWCFLGDAPDDYAVVGIISGAIGAALVGYGVYFVRKAKKLI